MHLNVEEVVTYTTKKGLKYKRFRMHFHRLLACMVLLRPLISEIFDFKDYKKAYKYIDANRETTLKVLIRIGD